MDVGLILDNPKRDLRGIVLLAHELLKRDARVFIVPMYQQGYDLPLIAPDVVVTNYARPNNKALLETYRTLGMQICVIDTEGGVLSESGIDSPDHWSESLRDTGLAPLVDQYFCWGSRVRDAFVRHGAFEPDRVVVTGCPRYDLCAPPWRQILQYRDHGFVLVNTNFSAINPAFRASDRDEIRIFKDLGWEADYVDRLFADLRAVFPRYIDAIADAAVDNPSRLFVVRPHPFERASAYTERLGHLNNVRIDGDGDVLNVIANADCVVHLNCGTSVETVLLGKVPIGLEFLNTETMRRHAPLPASLSCGASSRDDLNRLIRDPVLRASRHGAQDLIRERIVPWFHEIDGEAASRIATAIERSSAGRTRQARRSLRASLTGGRSRPSSGQLAQGVLANLVGSKSAAHWRERALPGRAAKFIDAETVQALLDRFAELDQGRRTARVRAAHHPISRRALASLELTSGG